MKYYLLNTYSAYPKVEKYEFDDIDKLMYQLRNYDVDFSIYSNTNDYNDGKEIIKKRIGKRIVVDKFTKKELSEYGILFHYHDLYVCVNVTEDRESSIDKILQY